MFDEKLKYNEILACLTDNCSTQSHQEEWAHSIDNVYHLNRGDSHFTVCLKHVIQDDSNSVIQKRFSEYNNV